MPVIGCARRPQCLLKTWTVNSVNEHVRANSALNYDNTVDIYRDRTNLTTHRARLTANEMSLRNLLRKKTEQLHAELDAVIGDLLTNGQQGYRRLLTLHAAVVLPPKANYKRKTMPSCRGIGRSGSGRARSGPTWPRSVFPAGHLEMCPTT